MSTIIKNKKIDYIKREYNLSLDVLKAINKLMKAYIKLNEQLLREYGHGKKTEKKTGR